MLIIYLYSLSRSQNNELNTQLPQNNELNTQLPLIKFSLYNSIKIIDALSLQSRSIIDPYTKITINCINLKSTNSGKSNLHQSLNLCKLEVDQYSKSTLFHQSKSTPLQCNPLINPNNKRSKSLIKLYPI